ncbi:MULTISPECIES: cation:proton antiporter [Francisella]|uniref:Cation:proton antiporter n=1 Tax=Francisella opportunistica TaxID=2016517 RepID=A0A345JQQ8_9GAMM|nr:MULTISPECIES: cation:proton antiporter [Francisella]APC91361.1 sodium/hydrogen exchanger [Francisella sp. MA067296]AXH29654.1 cation:proton antiporter [Francisella opportunistica]AXH31304.1 cation:proton antiporter [Francisella opportunistica]AXH32951.1 cation:proton antiporter [Francisella opportunistica]
MILDIFPLKSPVDIFGVILFIIFASSILSKFLRLPNIISLIIAGVLFGPYGFNILDQSLAVTIFAKTGLIYIMFLAGFELNITDFKINKNKIITFGALTFLIPFVLGFIVFSYFFNFSFQSAILTAIIFSTHTLITYPLVANFPRKNIISIVVGGTIITDTIVLFILAFFTNIKHQLIDLAIWSVLFTLAFYFIIFILVIFIFIPYGFRIFLNKFSNDKSLIYIFILLIVFASAIFAESIGMDIIIGAFFAGLVLSNFSNKIEIVKQDIYFIGNTLFIPVFLISIGMIFNYKILFKMGSYTLTFSFIIVAIFSKWLVAKVVKNIFNFKNEDQIIIFGLTNSHAAAALAVALIGFNIGVLNTYILNSTILLILISCLLSSLITSKAMKNYS